MSSFAGRMKEYPTISLDRFDRENIHAKAYFLSHCHKDHMKGLKSPALKRKLTFSLTVKLYCSAVTKEILLSNQKYAFWSDHIVALELESPTQIYLTDETTGEREDIVVTLLPAGHCPGSVMFLIEGAQGTVLYTGDFRLAQGDAARMELLHSGTRVKDIQSVYLDTTFYDPKYYQIPSREACLHGISQLVHDWVARSPYHVVWLNCKAAYGYEYLFTNLGEEFGCQIHVNRLDMFRKMPEILSHVTTDRATQIHACRHPKDEEFFRANRLPCGSKAPDGTPLEIISIKPSTMWFGERSRKTSVIVKMGRSSYRACFSFHSSYSEINDFLTYICPVNIYPSVIPLGRSLEALNEILKPMCREYSGRAEVIYKPLGTLKRARVDYTPKELDSHSELFDEENVAPVRRKTATKSAQPEALTSAVQAPPGGLEEPSLPPQPILQLENYVDCTESNDDDDEEEELEEPQPSKPVVEVAQAFGLEGGGSEPPRWEAFFRNEPLPTDESEVDNSQNSRTRSERTGSQTPETFEEDDSDAEERGLSQNSTVLVHSEERRQEPPRGAANDGIGEGPCECAEREWRLSDGTDNQSEPADPSNKKSDSQTSSDFEIPPTPESQSPPLEELKDLYRKLASGEDVVL